MSKVFVDVVVVGGDDCGEGNLQLPTLAASTTFTSLV